jgi:4-hydroxy-tetrahydrodipicolinate synthase
VCGLADDTVARLAEMPQVIGLKDATGDVTRPARLRVRLGSDFRLLSGDDATALAFLAAGGDGCISVTSNVAPGVCRNMYLALKRGQIGQAQRSASIVMKLTHALFSEPNPVPVKFALSVLNLMSPQVRLPLVELSNHAKETVAHALAEAIEYYPHDIVGGRVPPERLVSRHLIAAEHFE